MINKIVAWNVWSLNEIKQRELKILFLWKASKYVRSLKPELKLVTGIRFIKFI